MGAVLPRAIPQLWVAFIRSEQDALRVGRQTPRVSLIEAHHRREESVTLASEPGETHELMTLNIGLHHPATRGVLRVIATLEGEVVLDIKPIIGYVHTGIDKPAEDKSYWKVIPTRRLERAAAGTVRTLRRGRRAGSPAAVH
jgi:hypothetical protein